MDVSVLFEPITLKGVTLPNRIAMAPMTRSQSPGGVPGEGVAPYYARRAAADVGLIITEGITVDRPGASNDENVPGLVTPDEVSGWRHVVEAVHAAGGRIAPQLWHVGMMRKPGAGPDPDARSDSPSGITHKGKAVLPLPSGEEIADMASGYARSAAHAAAIGVDMLELHGAHGYLIDEFFWGVMNTRTDKYGGNIVRRTEFACEVIRKCRAAVGASMPIIIRLSQWKQQDFTARLAPTPDDLLAFAGALSEAGVDIFHCSQRRFWEPEFEGSDLNFAGWVKKLTGKPTISVGSVGLKGDFIGALAGQDSEIGDLSNLVTRLEREEFDLIAVGRALLQDPLWAQKVKQGRMSETVPFEAAALQMLY